MKSLIILIVSIFAFTGMFANAGDTATYNIVTGTDTLIAKRGDKIEKTFAAEDGLRIVGKWMNPVTKQEETKFEANGQTFYMQPGFTFELDTVAKTAAINGVLGDNENSPNINEENVPLGVKILFSLLGLIVVVFAGRWIRLR